MLKEVEVVEEGFEKVVDVLRENIEEIEKAQAEEIEIETQKIKDKYSARLNRYNEELSHLVHTEMIELPCEVTETDDIPEGAEVVDVVDIDEVPQEEKNYIGE